MSIREEALPCATISAPSLAQDNPKDFSLYKMHSLNMRKGIINLITAPIYAVAQLHHSLLNGGALYFF